MKKIDNRKNYYMVLDVETANSIGQPLAYDIGFAICDTQGNIYKSWSFVTQEIFFDEKKIYLNPKMMGSAYYHEKLPQYYKGIFETGDFKCKPLNYIRAVIQNECARYNVKAICCYNAMFDTRSLDYTVKYVSKSKIKDILPEGIEIYCIWNMACQTICQKKEYFKFCLDNGFVSNAGNIQTSAEIVYAYLTNNPVFEESHTGLADVLIESTILAECLKDSRKYKICRNIEPMPWKKPQAKFKKFSEKGLTKTPV